MLQYWMVLQLVLLMLVLSPSYSPGPMMVCAQTLNVKNVFGGRPLSMCCVADVLTDAVDELHKHFSLLKLKRSSYTMITPLGSEGGFHERVSCVIAGVADRLDTGPGTV